MAMAEAYFDWLVHLSSSPGKPAQLWHKGMRKAARLAVHMSRCAMSGKSEPCIAPLPNDRRFAGELWQSPPFNITYQSFLLQQQWWHNAATDVRGVTKHHERVLQFVFRQWLDVFAPQIFFSPIRNCCSGRRPRAGKTCFVASGMPWRTGSA